ncbi:Rep [Molossus molossus associated gemykibivirus 4]|nr:Rep [Molossus molossus associated gemykibivirus 4]
MAFRFRRRHALLTYAQCGQLDPWEVSNMLSDLGAECIIGREEHEDGGIHLHAFVDFGRQYSTVNPRQFDVAGCHPNILSCRKTPEKMYDYATKDGEIVAGGLQRPDGSELPPTRAYADWKYRPLRLPYETPNDYVFSTDRFPELDDWVRGNLEGHVPGRRGKSLVLIGESRLGKTAWARSLGDHNYFGGLFCLDDFEEDKKYAVFDDMQGGLEFFHGYKFWLGHQAQFYATDKYRGKKLITWGKPAIWCSNTDPRADKGADADWLDANCQFVFIDSKLY